MNPSITCHVSSCTHPSSSSQFSSQFTLHAKVRLESTRTHTCIIGCQQIESRSLIRLMYVLRSLASRHVNIWRSMSVVKVLPSTFPLSCLHSTQPFAFSISLWPINHHRNAMKHKFNAKSLQKIGKSIRAVEKCSHGLPEDCGIIVQECHREY